MVGNFCWWLRFAKLWWAAVTSIWKTGLHARGSRSHCGAICSYRIVPSMGVTAAHMLKLRQCQINVYSTAQDDIHDSVTS
eukprot:2571682-Amphidinium_carterae.1